MLGFGRIAPLFHRLAFLLVLAAPFHETLASLVERAQLFHELLLLLAIGERIFFRALFEIFLACHEACEVFFKKRFFLLVLALAFAQKFPTAFFKNIFRDLDDAFVRENFFSCFLKLSRFRADGVRLIVACDLHELLDLFERQRKIRAHSITFGCMETSGTRLFETMLESERRFLKVVHLMNAALLLHLALEKILVQAVLYALVCAARRKFFQMRLKLFRRFLVFLREQFNAFIECDLQFREGDFLIKRSVLRLF